MIFSGRHYSQLIQQYSQTFGQPVPESVLQSAAKSGKAPDLMEALSQAVESKDPIQTWESYGAK